MEIKNGVIPNKWDPRDRNYTKLAKASAPFDWSKGYDIEQELATVLNQPGFRIPAKDQEDSSSCGGQAGSYYRAVQEAFFTGNFTIRSAKDIYSQLFYPDGGIMPRDLVNLIVKKGVCQEQLIPSKDSRGRCPESFMREKKQTEMTKKDALLAIGLRYANVSKTMDALAQAVRDNHGIVVTLGGEDNGTWRTAYPVPPVTEEWAHYVFIGKAKMINGQKYLGLLNSWGDDCGDHGWQWIRADYLPHISNAYAVYDEASPVISKEVNLTDQLLTLVYTLWLRMTGLATKKKLA